MEPSSGHTRNAYSGSSARWPAAREMTTRASSVTVWGRMREAGEALRHGPVSTMAGAAGIGLGIAGGVTSAVAGDR